MKWFHHDCGAIHDPKLQTLADEFGPEGWGVYWGILEQIGQHSETFCLKLTGISDECDQNFFDLRKNQENSSPNARPSSQISDGSLHYSSGEPITLSKVPVIPVGLLSKNLYTSPRKLKVIMQKMTELGLFDSRKWLKTHVLFSPAFEQRADTYTRRQKRSSESGRTTSEVSANNVRPVCEHAETTAPVHVLLEQNRKEQKRKRKETEQSDDSPDLRTNYPQNEVDKSISIELPTEYDVLPQQVACKRILDRWNCTHVNPFEWDCSESDIRKLLLDGKRETKLELCRRASEVFGKPCAFGDLLQRAVQLMLETSQRSRISNPVGWLKTCLNGKGTVKAPWVLSGQSGNVTPSVGVTDVKRESRAPPQ